MSKDLIRKPAIVSKDGLQKPEQKQTEVNNNEVDEAARIMMERMLFGAEPRPAQDRPRIVLGFDCTSSMGEYIEARKVTPQAATTIADALFAKAGPAGLQVKLGFFRGDDGSSKQPRQLELPDTWYSNAEELARAMAAIEHWPGWTQHCALLRHVAEEAEKCAVQEVVVISDAFEKRTPLRPQGDDLQAALIHAQRLRDLGVTLTFAYKGTIAGGCPLDRAGINAEEAFRRITEANGGTCFLFNPAHLTERFSQIADRATLTAKGDVIGAQVLLEHLQAVPFEMNVAGEQVAKCDHE